MKTPDAKVHDLFKGAMVFTPSPKQAETERCEPFTLEEIDRMLPSFPEVMMFDLELCLKGMRHESNMHGADSDTTILGSDDEKIGDLKKRFYECIAWLFDLFESESRIPFEQACLCLAMDGDLIKTNVALGFSKQIRDFVTMYSFANPDDSKRVKRLFRGYLHFDH